MTLLMNDLVVESGAVVKWLIDEPHLSKARLILRRHRAGAVHLHAPEFLLAEVGNVLWKKQSFHGLAETHALDILDAVGAIAVSYTPVADLLPQAFRLAARHQRTVYDCLY